MKIKIQKTSILFLFLAFFMFGFQQNAKAQLTIKNETRCNMYYETYEGDKCSDAFSTSGWLTPGQEIMIPFPANWLYVDYGLTLTSPDAIPPPLFGRVAPLLSNCPFTNVFSSCLGGGVSHTWAGSGLPNSPVVVTVSN